MVFNVDKQIELWPPTPFKEKSHKFYIKNKILCDCIGIGSGSTTREGRVTGFNYGKQLGYALLAYFASIVLGFRRLPFCEDRIYSQYLSSNYFRLDDVLPQLNEEVINEIVGELRSLYDHTQQKLSEKKLTTVRLRREIKNMNDTDKYAETIMKLKDCASLLGYETISFEMDTLNSYGDEGAYKHLADITIEHEIEVKDILYCSELVGSHDEDMLIESGEWVVVNRSPTGIVQIPVKSIKVDDKKWKDSGRTLTESKAQEILNRTMPIELRNLKYNEEMYGCYGKEQSVRYKLAKWLVGE